MNQVTTISFDMEGTLIDHGYSRQIWEVDIPNLYGEVHRIGFEEAKRYVRTEYAAIGEGDPKWYDVGYWWSKFDLQGDWRELLKLREPYCKLYPDTRRVLGKLKDNYTLVVTSNTIREFLDVQIKCIGHRFSHIFSAPSDFKAVKKSSEFYTRILTELGIQPPNMVHIGDHRQFDYVAPRHLGIRAFLLDRSGSQKDEDVVFSLDAFVEQLNR
jgi:putative hydrolase of the HAD superfamily